MVDRFSPCVPCIVRFILLITFIGFGDPAIAQHTGYSAVADLPSFKKKFNMESLRIESISSNFTQEKILSALTEKITSSGKFSFKRSNKVRIEYLKPFVYLLVLNGDKMLIRDEQKESRINVKANRLFQQVNRIMVDCVQGTILDSKDFSSKVFEDRNTYLLEMTPTSKTLREFFQTILLVVDKKDYSAISIVMNEPEGDKTTITFTDKKLNTLLSDAVFAL
jgi:outer membrane lipoprotein-sorting protein